MCTTYCMTPQAVTDKIHSICKFISDVDEKKEFRDELQRILAASYRVKTRFDLWPESTTTWGPKAVYLSRTILGRPDHIIACLLIHESVHMRQYSTGRFTFWLNYANFYLTRKNNPLETEAHTRTQEFMALLKAKGIL